MFSVYNYLDAKFLWDNESHWHAYPIKVKCLCKELVCSVIIVTIILISEQSIKNIHCSWRQVQFGWKVKLLLLHVIIQCLFYFSSLSTHNKHVSSLLMQQLEGTSYKEEEITSL